MRIVHICLAAFYIDGFGYQENILPKVHRQMGHEVEIIASTETYLDHARLGHVEPSSYINEHGIQVHRLPYARWAPRRLRSKIRAYLGLEERLRAFRPDLIFVHDVQFWDFLTLRRYVLKNPTPIFADCHADYVNSAQGFVSRRILHRSLYRGILKRVDAVVDRYFPTLPSRADFLHEMYGLDKAKMELLPFGADDTQTVGLDRAAVRRDMRAALGIDAQAAVLVTGGKLDLRKNIHTLIERFSAARRAGNLRSSHLIVFGEPNADVQAELDRLDIDANVHMLGWTPASEIYKAFWAADLAIFPGTHSVLWEEAIGHGLGAVIHRWPGMDHLDLGQNVRFIDEASPATLDILLSDLTADNGAEIHRLTASAAEKGPRAFSFSAIAAKAIEMPVRPS